MTSRSNLIACLLSFLTIVSTTMPVKSQTSEASKEAIKSILTNCETTCDNRQSAYDGHAHNGQEQLKYNGEQMGTLSEAATKLHAMGTPVIPQLIEQLNKSEDPKPDSRGKVYYGAIAAANALGSFEDDMFDAILKAQSSHPKSATLYANSFLSKPADAVPFLASHLTDSESKISQSALTALIKIMEILELEVGASFERPSVQGISFRVPQAVIPFGVYYHHGIIQPLKLTLPAQTTLLKALAATQEPREQASIIQTLSLGETLDAKTVETIRTYLDDAQNEYLGHAAAGTLGSIVFREYLLRTTSGNKPAFSPETLAKIETSLRKAAHSKDGYTFTAAWLSLCRYGACYEKTSALADALSETARFVPTPRALAVQLMDTTGHPTPKQVIPTLITVLLDEEKNDGFTGKERFNTNPQSKMGDVLVKFGRADAQREALNLLSKLDAKTIRDGASSCSGQLQRGTTSPTPSVADCCKHLLQILGQ
jgi:uncharacterized protein involved in tolerance to divalent cations